MSHDPKNTLKEEIENYLNACGLMETLKAFRKEYGTKSENVETDILKMKKSRFAQRALENEAELRKIRLNINQALKDLANSVQKMAQLNVKLNTIADMCSKHVAFNLELIKAIEAKYHGYSGENSERCVWNADLNCKSLYESLTQKVLSIYCDRVPPIKDQNYLDLIDWDCSSPLVDCFKQGSGENSSRNTDIESDFQIIPDNELKNISPLDSIASLAEDRDKIDFKTSDHNKKSKIPFKNSLHNLKHLTSNTYEGFMNVSRNAWAPSGALQEHERTCSTSGSSVSYEDEISTNRKGNVKDAQLRKWCEGFLRHSSLTCESEYKRSVLHDSEQNTNVLCESEQNTSVPRERFFGSTYFLRRGSSSSTTADTTNSEKLMNENIFDVALANPKPSLTDLMPNGGCFSGRGTSDVLLSWENPSSVALSQSLHSSSFWRELDLACMNSNGNHFDLGVTYILESQSTDAIPGYAGADHDPGKCYFSDSYLTKLKNARKKSSSAVVGRRPSFFAAFRTESDSDSVGEKLEQNDSKRNLNDPFIFWRNKNVMESQMHDANNDEPPTKNSDTYLANSEKKMTDTGHNSVGFLKTPLMENIRESSICNNDQGQVSEDGLGSTRSGRDNTLRGRESRFSGEDLHYGRASCRPPPDKREKHISAKSTLSCSKEDNRHSTSFEGENSFGKVTKSERIKRNSSGCLEKYGSDSELGHTEMLQTRNTVEGVPFEVPGQKCCFSPSKMCSKPFSGETAMKRGSSERLSNNEDFFSDTSLLNLCCNNETSSHVFEERCKESFSPVKQTDVGKKYYLWKRHSLIKTLKDFQVSNEAINIPDCSLCTDSRIPPTTQPMPNYNSSTNFEDAFWSSDSSEKRNSNESLVYTPISIRYRKEFPEEFPRGSGKMSDTETTSILQILHEQKGSQGLSKDGMNDKADSTLSDESGIKSDNLSRRKTRRQRAKRD